MIRSNKFTCFLDTNVLFPFELRDLLLSFAEYDLFNPLWSESVFKELKGKLVEKNQMSETQAMRLITVMKEAFPQAMVSGFEDRIEALDLPDPGDRHILAAAIVGQSQVIITKNLKDFPANYLEKYHIQAKGPDDFLLDTIDLNPPLAIAAFKNMVLRRKNPNQDEFQVLDALTRAGYGETAKELHALIW